MSKVEITHDIDIEAKTALKKLKKVMADDSTIKKWDPTYQCEFKENGVQITGRRFNARITISPCKEETPGQFLSTVQASVDIPLMLTPFKNLVKTKLEKAIHKAFGEK